MQEPAIEKTSRAQLRGRCHAVHFALLRRPWLRAAIERQRRPAAADVLPGAVASEGREMNQELSNRIDAQIETLLQTILATRKLMRECIGEARQLTEKANACADPTKMNPHAL